MPKIAGLRARTGIPDFGYALGAVFTSFLFSALRLSAAVTAGAN